MALVSGFKKNKPKGPPFLGEEFDGKHFIERLTILEGY